jgi:hypothetical protein
VPRVVGAQARLVERVERLGVAGDGVAERVLSVEQAPREVVGVDLAPVVVAVFEDLFAHDGALDLGVEQERRRRHLPEQLDRARQVVRRHAHGHEAVVDVGGRVEHATQALERERELVRRGGLGHPTEEHVLEEVRDAVVGARLEPRAHPQVERRDGPVHGGGHEHEPEPVGQGALFVDGHRHAGRRHSRSTGGCPSPGAPSAPSFGSFVTSLYFTSVTFERRRRT